MENNGISLILGVSSLLLIILLSTIVQHLPSNRVPIHATNSKLVGKNVLVSGKVIDVKKTSGGHLKVTLSEKNVVEEGVNPEEKEVRLPVFIMSEYMEFKPKKEQCLEVSGELHEYMGALELIVLNRGKYRVVKCP